MKNILVTIWVYWFYSEGTSLVHIRLDIILFIFKCSPWITYVPYYSDCYDSAHFWRINTLHYLTLVFRCNVFIGLLVKFPPIRCITSLVLHSFKTCSPYKVVTEKNNGIFSGLVVFFRSACPDGSLESTALDVNRLIIPINLVQWG